MVWLLVAMATLGFVEIMARLPLKRTLLQFKVTVKKVMRVTRSAAISDHWKEKVMLAYALRMFKSSVLFLVFLLLALIPLLITVGLGRYLSLDVLANLSSIPGLVVATILAAGYLKLRASLVR